MYAKSGKTHDHPILWAFDLSAWSGKMRAYLIQRGAHFEQRLTSEPRFHREIVPKIGYFAAPVIECPDGTLLQDSTEAMRHLERTLDAPRQAPQLTPDDPFEAAVAWMLNFFGSDGFHKPGMHYRWNFPEEHDGWIRHGFRQRIAVDASAEQADAQIAAAMQGIKFILPHLGINAATAPTIERCWIDDLNILQSHFAEHDFLFGDRPTVADCGLMTMVYAHLARDPRPSLLMKQIAPDLFRWTERMNRPHWPKTSSNAGPTKAGLPPSLIAFLRSIFLNYGPELKGAVEAYNAWIDMQGEDAAEALNMLPGMNSPHPLVTSYSYRLNGVAIQRSVMLDTIYQYQYVTELLDALAPKDRSAMQNLLKLTGGSWLYDVRITKKLDYSSYKYGF